MAGAPCDLPAEPSSSLAVRVSETNDLRSCRAEELYPAAVVLPLLNVEWRSGELLIGPLALPGRAGCWKCALTRLSLAAASAECFDGARHADSADQEVPQVACQLLIDEIQAIIAGNLNDARLLDHLLIWNATSPRGSLHRVIPLSRCAVCGGVFGAAERTRDQGRISGEDSPETLLKSLAGWVDPRTGIVSRISLELHGDSESELPVVATTSPPYTLQEDGSFRRLPIGWGKGVNVSEAILSAVGEAVERYSAASPEPTQIVWACPSELAGEFLDPRSYGLYSESQYRRKDFPFARFDPTIQHPWVLGRWLNNDGPVWIPAVMVFLWMRAQPEHQICQGTSNGLAAGRDLDDAALRATLELVERDALLAAWVTATPGQRIELDHSLHSQLREVLNTIESYGAAIEAYLLPTAVCGSVVMCLAFGDGVQYPGVTIGLAADPDPLSAVRKAILELGQTGPHLRRMLRSGFPVPEDPSAVQEMLQHAAYYFPAERACEFDRLRSSRAPVHLCELAKNGCSYTLRDVASRLTVAGIRVAVVDVTSPDVSSGPFRVVRTVSPDLQDISYGYQLDRQPTKRILGIGISSPAPAISPIW